MLIAVPTNVLLIAYFTNTRIFTYIKKKTISKILFVYVYKSVFIFIEQKKKMFVCHHLELEGKTKNKPSTRNKYL